MIEQEDILYGTISIAGPQGTPGPAGANGRDGAIQYVAGENITISGNVISATGGGSAGVSSFNGRSGVVVPQTGDYNASMVGALPSTTPIPSKTSDLTNDSGFLTEHQSLASYRTAAAQDVIDNGKQPMLVAGSNITIQNNVISATAGAAGVSSFNGRDGAVFPEIGDYSAEMITDLAEVATSNDYNDLDNKPVIPTIPTNVGAFTNDVGYLTQHQSLSGYATQQWVEDQDYAAASSVPGVINNTTSTSTTDALSANMGKDLQTQITNLSTLGRFLSLWNATTGKPTTNPAVMPYTYKTGDYYIVSAVGTTNYKPDGTTYNNQASTTPETGSVGVSDMYYFDGTNWTLISKDLPTWSVDQTVISGSTNAVAGGAVFTELAGKQPTLTAGNSISLTSNTISVSSCPYTTVEPTAANTDGLKICFLQSEPATKYSGWIYLIADSQ